LRRAEYGLERAAPALPVHSRQRLTHALLFFQLSVGCSGLGCNGSDPAAAVGSLEGVRVSVPRALIDRMVRERGIDPERARAMATEDALLAEYLRVGKPIAAASVESVALARALLSSLSRQADEQGPPTDAELALVMAERWYEFDRPRMVRILHAVVLSQAENPAAKAVAERIYAAVVDAPKQGDFRKLAQAVPADGFTVKLEKLPPVAPDGRAADPKQPPPPGYPLQTFVNEFAVAAQRMTRVGETSAVVRTPFGYHVLRLLEVLEPMRADPEALRVSLDREIKDRRGRELAKRVLEKQRASAMPEQSRSALAAMAELGPPR
jgi:hypothetical protein